MTIYQVISKDKQLEYAYLSYEMAAKHVAKLNKANKDNHFSINTVQDEAF